MAPQRAQMEPKEYPKGAKGAQSGPKGAQMELKREPKKAQRPPPGPQRHLKTTENVFVLKKSIFEGREHKK